MEWAHLEAAAKLNASVYLLNRIKCSDNHYTIALFTADRCGKARAESPD
jgi:hypothetical protein